MAAATTKQKQLTPVQRAAAVVIALGADRASEVYRYLKDDEVEQISLEIAKLNRLSPEDMQSTIEDFYGLCVTQKVITEGGVLYAKDVLEKAFGPEQASSYMDRLSKSLRTRSFESIRKADYKNLWMILQNEHPQTIALVLSYARSDQAAQIIADHELNVRQAETLCKKLAKPPKEPVEPAPRGTLPVEVEESLKQALGSEVNVAYHDGKGKLTVHFYSDEQLKAFANLLGQYQVED
mgnify:FL=1